MTDTVIIRTDLQRATAIRMINAAAPGTIVTFREATRSLEQNAKLWAMLADVSKAMPMGRPHTPDDWKAIFCNACGWEVQFVEGLDGRPFPMGFRTSKMNKGQMSALIEYITAFGAEHRVLWSGGIDTGIWSS